MWGEGVLPHPRTHLNNGTVALCTIFVCLSFLWEIMLDTHKDTHMDTLEQTFISLQFLYSNLHSTVRYTHSTPPGCTDLCAGRKRCTRSGDGSMSK